MAEVKNTPEAPKRTASDIEVIVKRASVGDWLFVQRAVEMTRDEIMADSGVLMVTLAYFIEKQSGTKANFNTWLHAPSDELAAFLNLEEEDSDE